MLNEYAEFTDTTAVYPCSNTGDINELFYLALGLNGEAGEVANKIKKLYRDDLPHSERKNIISECGDVLWYLIRLIRVLGGNPEAVVCENWAKLQSRKDRGVLHGGGDKR